MTEDQEREAFLQMMGDQSLEKMGSLGEIIRPELEIKKSEEVEQDVKKDETKENEVAKPKEEAAKKEEVKEPKSKEVSRQKNVLADFNQKQQEFKAEREKFKAEFDKFTSEKSQVEQTQKVFSQELDELRRFKREVEHSIKNGGHYTKLDPEVFKSNAKKLQDEAKKALADDDSERAKQLFTQADQELKNAEYIESVAKEFIENDKKSYQEKVQAKNNAIQEVFKAYPNLAENNYQNPFYQMTDSILKGQQIKMGDKALDTSHLASWLSSIDNPNGAHYAARLADLILFKNTAQGEVDRLTKELETLKKEKEELISNQNISGSYAHGGKSEKTFSEMSPAEKDAEEKRQFEEMYRGKLPT